MGGRYSRDGLPAVLQVRERKRQEEREVGVWGAGDRVCFSPAGCVLLLVLLMPIVAFLVLLALLVLLLAAANSLWFTGGITVATAASVSATTARARACSCVAPANPSACARAAPSICSRRSQTQVSFPLGMEGFALRVSQGPGACASRGWRSLTRTRHMRLAAQKHKLHLHLRRGAAFAARHSVRELDVHVHA